MKYTNIQINKPYIIHNQINFKLNNLFFLPI